MTRRSRRTFAPEFKAKVILDILTGTATTAELCRKHQIGPGLVALWKATFLERLPAVFQADEQRSADAARVAELERLVGQQALELAALKKASTWRAGATTGGGRS
jgi:transposase